MNKIHLSSVDSTNDYLKSNYKNLDNYTFVSSDNQTKGRGRNNRTWLSENGKNLLFSLLILDRKLINYYKDISINVAYFLSLYLKKIGIEDVMIKWPNDIYVKGKKICGILLESVSSNDIDCLIVGVGLNVNQNIFSGEYRCIPTSMNLELNSTFDINVLKEELYPFLIEHLNSLLSGDNYYNEISKLDYLKGKDAYYDNRKVNIIGIDKDFSLKIKEDNKLVNIFSGEINL